LIVPREVMKNLSDTTVAAEFCRRLLGAAGGAIAAAAIAISVFGALNGNLLVGPRLLFAMGADRLAPRGLNDLHPRYQTPAKASLLMAGWSSPLVLIGAAMTQVRLPTFDLPLGKQTVDLNLPPGKQLFDVITDFAMFGAVALETLAVV